MELVNEQRKIFSKEGFLSFLKKSFPYILLILGSLLPFWFWIIYTDFITGGDDVATHISLVYDLVYGFEHGFFYSTNHVYLGIFAYDASLFYGMFPHYVAAILKYLFSWAGLNVIGSIKLVSIISQIVGTIFTYNLALLITKNKTISLGCGFLFAFMPYRIFCFYFRFAWAEAIATCFIPIFFYALYRIFVYDKKIYVAPFILLVTSLAMEIMSHPFSAILTVFAGAIVVLFNIKNIILKIKEKNIRWFTYLGISIVLEIGLVFVFVFPMFQALESGIYRVSYDDIMWTSLEAIISRIPMSNQFSGFLNFFWLGDYNIQSSTDSVTLWAVGITLFIFIIIAVYVDDYLILKYCKYQGKWLYLIRALITFVIMFVPNIIASQRIETYLAMSLFYVLYLILYILPLKKWLCFENEVESYNKSVKEESLSLIKDNNIYACLLILIIGFLYLYTSFIWKISPSFLYMGQFPFRFWSIVGMFMIILVCYLIKPFIKIKAVQPIFIGLSCFLLTLDMGMVDKRLFSLPNENPGSFEPDMQWIMNIREFGAQNEYMPQIIYDIYRGDVKPSYPNSLANKVGLYVVNKLTMIFDMENYITPQFLEGEGDIDIFYLNTPDVKFNVATNSDNNLIQIPQFYYDGYNAKAVFENGETQNLEVVNVDGLVSCYAPKGTYQLEFTFPGNTLKQAGWYVLSFSIVGVISFAIYGYLNRKNMKKLCK